MNSSISQIRIKLNSIFMAESPQWRMNSSFLPISQIRIKLNLKIIELNLIFMAKSPK
jgi:hypothetical protein